MADNEKIKKAWLSFLKGLIPLFTTFIGSLLGGLFGGDNATGSTVGALVGGSALAFIG